MEKEKHLYKVTVTETLQRSVTITADNELDAVQKVQDMYDNEEIVLDYRDYTDTNIDANEVNKEINDNNENLSLEELQNLLDGKDDIDLDY